MMISLLGDHFSSDLVEVLRGCAWSSHDEPLRPRADAEEGKAAEYTLTKLRSPDERPIADSIPERSPTGFLSCTRLDSRIVSSKWIVSHDSMDYPDGL
jgi:hypothetical protein